MRTMWTRAGWAAGGVAAALACGCRHQGSPLTNPFIPDRVPPPATRTLPPGTAAPYYPGDPVPGAATLPAAPPIGAPLGSSPALSAPPAATYPPTIQPAPTYAPGAAYPPATTYPPAIGAPAAAYPASPAPFTTPPGGWGAYPPQSQATPGDAVRTAGDSLPERLVAAPAAAADKTFGPAGLAAEPSSAPVESAAIATAASTFPANAGAQGPAAPSEFQQVRIREVTPAEYLSPVAPSASAAPVAIAATARDGFRPQSPAAPDEPAPSQEFRPPSIRRGEDAGASANQYAASADFQSLRGQLEYWSETGAWSIRYLPAGSPADALGGRVAVDNPQVFANLQPGELVAVNGQLYSQQTPEGVVQPAYRVAVVQRQRR